MNTRFLTILSLLALLGFSASAVAHPCQEGQDPPDTHKHCSGGNNDGGEEYYDVEISIDGDLNSGGDLWEYNGRSIDYTTFNRHGSATATLDLTYFIGKFPTHGTECFDVDPVTGLVDLHAGGVLKRRKSDAHGKFWFEGSTYPVLGKPTLTVLYLLIVDGYFSNGPEGWPGDGDGNYMHMTDWELKVENVGADIAERSCEGSETDAEDMNMKVHVYGPYNPNSDP